MMDERAKKRIEQEARKVLEAAKQWGRFPTDFELVSSHLKVSLNETPIQHSSFLGALFSVVKKKAAEQLDSLAAKFPILENAFRGIKGIFLFEERTIFIDQNSHPQRANWYKWHEMGHATIPWHEEILKRCKEEDMNLWARENLEQEANLCAAQYLFQGENFQHLVDDINTDSGFDAIDNARHACRTSLESCAREFTARYQDKTFYFILVRKFVPDGKTLPLIYSESIPIGTQFSMVRLRLVAREVFDLLSRSPSSRLIVESHSLLISGKEVPVIIDCLVTPYRAFALFKIPKIAIV